MVKIAELYGCTVDSLYHYLRTGRWKRTVSVIDVEGYMRSIEDPKILLAIMSLAQSLLEEKINALPLPEPKKEVNPCERLIKAIELESSKVESAYQWETLLRAFEISEQEIENLYVGETPSLALLMKLSKVLRMEVDELTDLLDSPPETITIQSIPTDADSIEECIDGKHCGEDESTDVVEAEADMLLH